MATPMESTTPTPGGTDGENNEDDKKGTAALKIQCFVRVHIAHKKFNLKMNQKVFSPPPFRGGDFDDDDGMGRKAVLLV